MKREHRDTKTNKEKNNTRIFFFFFSIVAPTNAGYTTVTEEAPFLHLNPMSLHNIGKT